MSKAPSILEFLERRFPNRVAINRNEFRALLDLSKATDARLKREGNYPPILIFSSVTASRPEGKILLTDLASWLASVQIQELDPTEIKLSSDEKQDLLLGSKNKSQKTKDTKEIFTFKC